MNSSSTTRSVRRTMSIVVLAACGVAACSGSDGTTSDSSPSEGSTPAPVASAPGDTDPGSDQLDPGAVGESVFDTLDEDDAAALDEGIASLSADTRYSIVADQIDPRPTVEIDGSNIRLVFTEGSVENAFGNCMIATVIREQGETVTAVYPDGEEEC